MSEVILTRYATELSLTAAMVDNLGMETALKFVASTLPKDAEQAADPQPYARDEDGCYWPCLPDQPPTLWRVWYSWWQDEAGTVFKSNAEVAAAIGGGEQA